MHYEKYQEAISYIEAEVTALKRLFLSNNGWKHVINNGTWLWRKHFKGTDHYLTQTSAIIVEVHTQQVEEEIHGT